MIDLTRYRPEVVWPRVMSRMARRGVDQVLKYFVLYMHGDLTPFLRLPRGEPPSSGASRAPGATWASSACACVSSASSNIPLAAEFQPRSLSKSPRMTCSNLSRRSDGSGSERIRTSSIPWLTIWC